MKTGGLLKGILMSVLLVGGTASVCAQNEALVSSEEKTLLEKLSGNKRKIDWANMNIQSVSYTHLGSVEADSLFAEYRNADNDTLVDGVLEVRCIHCFAPGFRKEGSISFLLRADCCSFLHHVSVSDYFQNQSVGYTDICLRSSAERNIRCIPNLDGI